MSLWINAADPVELRPNASEADLQAVIRAAYKQVLGNVQPVESERLVNAESQLRNGDITVKGFVAAIAKSDLYRAWFFETSSSYRFVELNCKHLLGRAPLDQAEISAHIQTYNTQGYEAEINAYLDSDEYNASFGENVVPYCRTNTTQTGVKNVDFNRTFALNRGNAASDRDGDAKLIGAIAGNQASKIVAPAAGSGAYSNTGKRFRIAVSKANHGPRVTRSNTTFEIGFAQLSKKIQNIQKTGGQILSITEA
ncbi:MAG: phycobilisome rod-core linker polypeptide [Leptolyngbyaceae cyanobacterium]